MQKDVYPSEYLNKWEKFNESSLPRRDDFQFKLENVNDVDYTQPKKACKNFEIKNLEDYHNLHIESDTLLSVNVFENFQNMCLEIYELDPFVFLMHQGFSIESCLKKTDVKLDLLTDMDFLIMVEKVLEGKYVILFIDMQKLIRNTWKFMIIIKNCHKETSVPGCK